jgi:transglutaminase-like putative cysteine protease
MTFCSRVGAAFAVTAATATAFVLRAAGIPARLVTGYLGGEESEGNYLEVHQFDAHAWWSIWMSRTAGSGSIPPPQWPSAYRGVCRRPWVASSPPPTPLPAAKHATCPAQPAALVGANLDYQWTRWVLNYDAASLWQQLGQRWPVLAGHAPWLILAALPGVASLVGGPLIWRGPAPLPLRLQAALRRRAARHGWQPLAGESLASW